MSNIEKKSRLRREQDILDRLENVKRLIQMETTLLTSQGCGLWHHYQHTDRDGKACSDTLLRELREEIQMQLYSIAAICYGHVPDIGEPCPMLEWNTNEYETNDINLNEHPEDLFHDIFNKVLTWNA